jgi:hypothetical protein
MELAPPNGVVVAAEPVALILTGFHHSPPMSCVRSMYLEKLRGVVSDTDLNRRIALHWYIGNTPGVLTVGEAVQLIEKFDCRTVVFQAAHRDAETLVNVLQGDGFTFTSHYGFLIGVRVSSFSRSSREATS